MSETSPEVPALASWTARAGREACRRFGQGGESVAAVLPAPVARALRVMLSVRTAAEGPGDRAPAGSPTDPAKRDAVSAAPLFATATGGRLDQPQAWRLVRRLANAAGLAEPERVSPHALRHAFITLALDAGASLRDVQHATGHADPSTTRAYDEARGRLDRHPAYAVSAHLAAGHASESTTTPAAAVPPLPGS